MNSEYTYLALLAFTLAFPLGASWDKRFTYARKWPALFPALLITAFVFIVWDVWFTAIGVWGFNPDYYVGWNIAGLPIEEWLFFLIIPFSCLFIYECVKYFFPSRPFRRMAPTITRVMAVGLFLLGLVFYDRWYTFVAFETSAVLLIYQSWFRRADYMDHFWPAYLLCWIPFVLVNGVLTGSGLADPVVWYNDAENLGIRLFTIPLDDGIYLLGLLLMNVTLYEYFLEKKKKKFSEL